MRRDVGGHAYRNAIGAVDQEVGEASGQHLRLFQRLVVVGLEVHGFLVQVPQQLHGRLVKARLGIAHGGGGVTVNGAEVAMAVHQGHPHAEVLSKANHGVVDGGVAVGMVLTHAVAHGTG